MERGFKKRAENIAINLRREIGLGRTDALAPQALADYLSVTILSLTDIPNVDPRDIEILLADSDAWSAVTVSAAGRDAIIINPIHTGGRPASDLMHEMSHLLLGHEPSKFFFTPDADFVIRQFNQEDEEEATWLAGCLLLPREALVSIAKRRISDEDTCREYGVSSMLLRFRVDKTGVSRQFARKR